MRLDRRLTVTVLAGAACMLPAACSDDGPDDARSKHRVPFHATVGITSTGYHPSEVRILVGGTVTWINRDPEARHTAETREGAYKNLPGGQDASFDTHTLSWGEPYTVTFHSPGTFAYSSSFDFGWKGQVEVVERTPPQRHD